MSNSARKRDRWSLEHRLLFGQISCLCFGMGLILWGLAPTLMQRILTNEPPSTFDLAVNLACFLVAVLFIGFHLLIKRRVRWAAWAAFLVSCVIVGAGVTVSFGTGFQLNNSFILFLSAATCFASWLAIEAIAKWPLEGPYAIAAEQEEHPGRRSDRPRGTFVPDEPVRTGAKAHARMFRDASACDEGQTTMASAPSSSDSAPRIHQP
jgi:hypothetical protein